MWHLKNKTNKQNKTETDSQIQKTNWQSPKEVGGGLGEIGAGGVDVQTFSYKINKSQGCNEQLSKYCQ